MFKAKQLIEETVTLKKNQKVLFLRDVHKRQIPMTRYFYEYQPPEPVDDIVKRIKKLESEISESLNALFHKENKL